jgi:hypothetical protein
VKYNSMLFDGSMVNGMICVRKQGTRFLLRKILIALRSTKLSMLGNSMRPYMSKARISSKEVDAFCSPEVIPS